MSEPPIRYPRTLHLPWSPGRSRDDLVLPSIDQFEGHEVVVTEKMDGEGTTLTHETIYARSPSTAPHPSRAWARRVHGQVGYLIPQGRRVFAENCYAVHSIRYDALPSYLLVYGGADEDGFLSWDEVVVAAASLGLPTVPVLYRGIWNEAAVCACQTAHPRYGSEQEGYVVRLADRFAWDAFGSSVAKFVREGHVTTDEHWLGRAVVANGLARPIHS